jgi:hypothetical protein
MAVHEHVGNSLVNARKDWRPHCDVRNKVSVRSDDVRASGGQQQIGRLTHPSRLRERRISTMLLVLDG